MFKYISVNVNAHNGVNSNTLCKFLLSRKCLRRGRICTSFKGNPIKGNEKKSSNWFYFVGFDIFIWLPKSDLDYDDDDDNHKTIITTIQGIMTS